MKKNLKSVIILVKLMPNLCAANISKTILCFSADKFLKTRLYRALSRHTHTETGDSR